MSARQKIWAKKRKASQFEELGGKCISCDATENLERDCIVPQGDAHHKMSTDQRTSFYNQQMRAGNVQLLCSKCHTKKTIIDTKPTAQERATSTNRNWSKELGRRLTISNPA
jgi:5-methylcytosine-specific restriction endonuclease McrA